MRRGLSREEIEAFLWRPLLATLATLRPDGSALLSPVWYEWRDRGFNVWTGRRDVKARHLRRDPRATIAVYEHELPYTGVEARGEVLILEEEVAVTALRIAGRYIGPSAGAAYTEGSAGDVIIRLEPTELRSWDFSDEWAPGPS